MVDDLCNKCGESCVPKDAKDLGIDDNYGLINAEFITGYFSKWFGDGFVIRFSLCERCVLEISETFKIPIIKKEYM